MICANPDCKKDFSPKTHNQKYCSSECCKIVTNEDIKRKYHAKRARLKGLARYCACGTQLSRYNGSDKCGACEATEREEQRINLLGLLNVIKA